MARRKSVNFIRNIEPDVRYGSEDVQKFINVVMWRGKKNAARTIVYDALDILTKKSSGDQDKALICLLVLLNKSLLLLKFVHVVLVEVFIKFLSK